VEVHVGGFGSIFLGKTFSGDRADYFSSFLGIEGYDCPCTPVDYVNGGIYQSKWQYQPDTNFGLQSTLVFNDKLSLTSQVTAYAADDYDVDLSWFLLKYQLTDELRIDVGRKRIPLFYYSDYYDIGYAIPWVRPPGDLYGWQAQSFNGVSLIHHSEVLGGSLETTLWYGEEDTGEIYGYEQLYFGRPISVEWNSMRGIAMDYTKDWYNVRVVFMENNLNQFEEFPPWTQTQFHRDQSFLGVALNLDYNNWFLKSEYNEFSRNAPSFDSNALSLSIGYVWSQFTVALSYSEYEDLDAAFGNGKQDSHMATFRWDFAENIAFKLQLDRFNDDADWIGVDVPGGDFVGDSSAIAFGFDFIF